jgi:hypothetical protein
MTLVMAVFAAAPKKDHKLAEAEARWLEKVKAKAVGESTFVKISY